MHTRWKNWVHVTKLDPDKMLPAGAIAEIASSGTDALMLSGTLNVTAKNMAALADEAKVSGLPLIIEPADPEAVLWDGVDLVFVPSVLNSADVQWIVGKHRSWIQRQRVQWEKVVPEAYIVMNPDSSVGKVTRANCSLTEKEVASFAALADHYFHFPIVYIEYSGNVRRSCDSQSGSRCGRIGSHLLRGRDQLGREGIRDGPVCRHHRCGKRRL